MIRVSLVIPVCILLMLSGCVVFDIANLAAPDEGYSEIQDIRYGMHERQKLDIYLPDAERRCNVTIVWFYGGGWRKGSREQYRFVGRRLAALGYDVAVPDYRLYPEVTFPAFVEDGADAVSAVLGDLGREQGLSGPVFMMGHSAGAHIAMLIALDERYLDDAGSNQNEIAGVIGLAGAYDFLPFTSDFMHDVFPGPEAEADSQPVNFVDAADPPVLLLHGDADRRVWLRNSERLHKRMSDAAADSTLRVYPGVSHSGIVRPLAGFGSADSALLPDIAEFIFDQPGINPACAPTPP